MQQWMTRAKCLNMTPDKSDELFFFESGGKSKAAKKFCDDCDVKLNCLKFALKYKERGGIWGGLTETERDELPESICTAILDSDDITVESEVRYYTWSEGVKQRFNIIDPNAIDIWTFDFDEFMLSLNLTQYIVDDIESLWQDN